MAQGGVPARLRDVTPDWLTDALRSSATIPKESRVRVIEPAAIGLGVGFVGRCLRLKVDYEPAGAGPESMVLKMPAGFEPSRRLGMEWGLYETEALFYQKLAARTLARLPTCYCAAFEEAGGGFLLVLEDLSRLRATDHSQGCTYEDSLTAVLAAARIHASWWESPELAVLLRTRDRFNEGSMYSGLEASWPAFLEFRAPRLDREDVAALERIRANLPFLRRWSAQVPPTLSHGDYRLENFFFDDGPEGPQVVVLDWQLAAYGAGAGDLAYFLSWNLTPEQRREREKGLLESYLRELVKQGVSGYGREQLWEDYRLALLLCSLFVPAAAGDLREVLAAVAGADGPGAESMRYAMERNEDLQMLMLTRSLRAIHETGALDLLPE